MNTLILASSGQFIVNNDIDRFLPKPLLRCSIASIITASKKVPDTGYVKRHRVAMQAKNISYSEIDIAEKDEQTLAKELDGYDIIYVEGGNTFYLLQCVRESGFKNVVSDLLARGVVYIGSSAGSYIACPSIVMATWSKRGFDQCGITDYTGMNLAPFLIKAHYVPDMLPSLKERAKDLHHPLRAITDEQAIIVQNDRIQLLGGGDEIVL